LNIAEFGIDLAYSNNQALGGSFFGFARFAGFFVLRSDSGTGSINSAQLLRVFPTSSLTAKGFIFISMEDETGICNVIVTPDLYDCDRLVVTRSKFLLVEGPLQNQDNVIHVKAMRLILAF
jgi:DNA polymerase III alpha subunit